MREGGGILSELVFFVFGIILGLGIFGFGRGVMKSVCVFGEGCFEFVR